MDSGNGTTTTTRTTKKKVQKRNQKTLRIRKVGETDYSLGMFTKKTLSKYGLIKRKIFDFLF